MSASSIVCPTCGTPNPSGFKFCGNCGTRLLQEEAVAEQAAERRQITVMFCDLVGSVAMSLKLDPEDLRDIIRRYQDACVDAIEAYEGHVAQYLGDGILAYFGYPVMHDGEAERAVRAGLDVVARMQSLSAELERLHGIDIAVRVGIDTGLVVVGAMGRGANKEHLALGETPNRAARLQSVAPPNGLVISQSTQRLVAEIFETENLGAQALKGIAGEEKVFRIVSERMPGSPLDLAAFNGRLSTMGREFELDVFRECWSSVEQGSGRVLMMRGEPGIGKSHVVQLFRQELSGVRHARVECRCSPYLQGGAFHPLIDWLQRVFNFYPDQSASDRLDMVEFVCERNGLEDRDAPRLLASLLSLPVEDRYKNPGYSAALARDRTQKVLEELVLKMADDRPLLMIVEDLQWIDPSTKGFLERLANVVPKRSLLLVLTARQRMQMEWPQGLPVTIISLDRMDREQVKTIIEEVAGEKSVPQAVVDQIVQKSDGIPLFVQEFTRMVIEADDDVDREEGLVNDLPDLAIPATLHDSLMARLDRLHSVKEVAQLCSVLGREFSFELARAASRLSEIALAGALSELVRAEVLLTDGEPPRSRYLFRHMLIQETAYESMLRSRRAVYHRRVARYLIENRERESLEVIAHHLTKAGDVELAATYWCRAGDRAHERWANEEAIDYYSRGKNLLDDRPETAENRQLNFFLQAGLAVASLPIRGYTHPGVLAAFERAAELSDGNEDAASSIPVVRGLWAYYTVLADHDRAACFAEQYAVRSKKAGNPILQVEAASVRGSTLLWKGEVREARVHLQEAATGLRQIADEPPRALSFQHPYVGVLAYLSFASWYLGHPEDALEHGREAIEVAERHDHPFSRAFAYGFDAALKTYLGMTDEARKSAEKSFEISSRFGFPFWLNIGRVLSGWTMASTDPDEAVKRMQSGLDALQKAGVRIWTAYPSALLAQLLGDRGDPSEALAIVDGVVERNRSNGEGFLLPEIQRIRAGQLDALGRSDEANAERMDALELAQSQGARPLALRLLLDLMDGSEEPSAELRDLLRTTTDGYAENIQVKDVVSARRIIAAGQKAAG